MNKRYVLKSNEDISRIVKAKKCVANKHFVLYYEKKETSRPKIAISISKHVGKAHIRNHEKRVMREIIRKDFLPSLAYKNVLIVLKGSSIELDYNEKKRNIEMLIKKIKEKADEVQR